MSYNQLLQTLMRYYMDVSRPKAETKSDLIALRDEIDSLIDALNV